MEDYDQIQKLSYFYGKYKYTNSKEYFNLTGNRARAISAVLSLFSTIDISGLGIFQDSGMRQYNNSINLVFSETKYFWPNSPSSDIFILFGTGSESTDLSSNTVLRFRNILVDG